MTSKSSGDFNIIRKIANRMILKEGEEAVRRVLWEVYRQNKITTKEIARSSRLPTPVAAAIRRELEKEGIIARKSGANLTEDGKKYLEKILGIVKKPPLACTTCQDRKILLSEEHYAILKTLKEYSLLRPKSIPQLDQTYATPETALHRALYLFKEGDLAGRRVLFLGDDDLTSVACDLLGVAKEIIVIDIDERLLKFIKDVSKKRGQRIECIHHDLRESLPKQIEEKFDTFLTDPPYTLPGLKLFLSRGIQALRKRKTSSVYLAFPDKPPLEMLQVHKAILEMGLFVSELLPRFNEYEGAEILANTTFMAKLMVTEEAKPSIPNKFKGRLYTGEVKPSVRTYRCQCGENIEVGTSKEFKTIEELKRRGCPLCGSMKGFIIIKKKWIR